MRVMLTRPRPESEVLAEQLRAPGEEILIEPMLNIVASNEPVSLEGIQAVLATSANGVRCLAATIDQRDLPLFAVGDATARSAADAGFTRIENAQGESEALGRLVAARLSPADGSLLHIRGQNIAGDLAGQLETQGFTVTSAILYRAEPATELSSAARSWLETEKCDAILFFSPRTARTFVSLLNATGLQACCARITALCLSQAVADEAAAISWGDLRIAMTPDSTAMIQLYDELRLTKDTHRS